MSPQPELPPGWQWSTLGAVGRYHNGRAFKKAEWRESGRPIIRIQNLTDPSKSFNYFQGDADERHVVRSGDVLVSWAATLGAYRWTGPEAVLNQHIFKVESYLDPEFHLWLLRYVVAALYARSHGSGIVHVTRGQFDALPVAVPPRDQQARTVDAIEEEFARIDAIEAELDATDRLNEQFRRALLRDAFAGRLVPTRGITDAGAMEQDGKVALPAGWRWAPLESACKVFTDGDWVLKEDLATGRDVRLLQLGDIGVGVFRDKTDKWISAERAEQLGVTLIADGDVLISRMAHPLARACVVDDLAQPTITAVDVTIARPDSAVVSSAFLAMALNDPSFTARAEQASSGTTRKRITRKKLGVIEIPLPPPAVQDQIVTEVGLELDRVARVRLEIDNTRAHLKQLRSTVLHQAFQGNLVANSKREG